MSETSNYGLYVTSDEKTKFKDWREKVAGENNSNMAKIDAALSEKAEHSRSVAVTLNPECGHYAETKAPWVGEDTSSVPREDSPLIRVYSDVDSRYVLEDFINKLQLQYS